MTDKEILYYQVRRRGRCVLFRIYAQHSRLINAKVSNKGLGVYCCTRPGLTATAVFLRGDDTTGDHKQAVLYFDSIVEAQAYRLKVIKALDAYIKHVRCELEPEGCLACDHASVCRMHDALLDTGKCDLYRKREMEKG